MMMMSEMNWGIRPTILEFALKISPSPPFPILFIFFILPCLMMMKRMNQPCRGALRFRLSYTDS